MDAFQNTNPERGRKPHIGIKDLIVTDPNFRTQTPKGDGNYTAPIITTNTLRRISEHKPRKGTETVHRTCPLGGRGLRFQNTNPERGRKLIPARADSNSDSKFQNTNPERGRKRNTCLSINRNLFISEHKPRKGTETNVALSKIQLDIKLISEHKPRKGTETGRPSSASAPRCSHISEHKPRKGTAWEMIPFRWNHLFCLYIVFTSSFGVC